MVSTALSSSCISSLVPSFCISNSYPLRLSQPDMSWHYQVSHVLSPTHSTSTHMFSLLQFFHLSHSLLTRSAKACSPQRSGQEASCHWVEPIRRDFNANTSGTSNRLNRTVFILFQRFIMNIELLRMIFIQNEACLKFYIMARIYMRSKAREALGSTQAAVAFALQARARHLPNFKYRAIQTRGSEQKTRRGTEINQVFSYA